MMPAFPRQKRQASRPIVSFSFHHQPDRCSSIMAAFVFYAVRCLPFVACFHAICSVILERLSLFASDDANHRAATESSPTETARAVQRRLQYLSLTRYLKAPEAPFSPFVTPDAPPPDARYARSPAARCRDSTQQNMPRSYKAQVMIAPCLPPKSACKHVTDVKNAHLPVFIQEPGSSPRLKSGARSS